MTDLEVLKAARASITDPDNWAQGEFRDQDGRMCLAGAILDAAGYAVDGGVCLLGDAAVPWQLHPAISAVQSDLNDRAIPVFNDTSTHGDVLALLDRVIAKLEEAEYGNPLPPLPAEAREAVAA